MDVGVSRGNTVRTGVKSYVVPSIIAPENIDDDEARFEMFCYAFDLVSRDFLKAKNKIEEEIATVERDKEATRKYYVVTGAIMIISTILVISLANPAFFVIGFFGVIGIVAVYLKMRTLKTRINELSEELSSLQINKKITFISKLSLPVYLSPYKKGVMVFDALAKMPSTSLKINNLPWEQLQQAFEELQDITSSFEMEVSPRDTLKAEEINQIDSTIKDERLLEKPIFDILDNIADLSENVEREDIRFQIYDPETAFVESIQELFVRNLLIPSKRQKIPTTRVEFTINEARRTVERLKGIKASAMQQDTIGSIAEWKQEVESNRVLENIKAVLRENIDNSKKLFEQINEELQNSMYDYICPGCAEDHLEEMGSRFKLVTTFYDYLGTATEGFKALGKKEQLTRFQERLQNIAANIGLDIPDEVIPGMIDYAKMRIEKRGGVCACDAHPHVTEFIEVPRILNVFARTSAKLFDELRKPVRDVLKGASKQINDTYLATKGQKLALLPLEEIHTQLQIKTKELEAAVREAELVLSNI